MLNLAVFSTSVEVFLTTKFESQCFCGLLHVRGGVSKAVPGNLIRVLSSPRPWRCFSATSPTDAAFAVFSTSVEVFLSADCAAASSASLLHVRGGVSKTIPGDKHTFLSSPRPWRCFQMACLVASRYPVFSTSVEVFPPLTLSSARVLSLLHVRGGVSTHFDRRFSHFESSPRPWRCFQGPQVFSRDFVGLLHVRGGVSARVHSDAQVAESSPRPWRCFLFSEMPNVQRRSLLHVRGGVSTFGYSHMMRKKSSPRPWRCFRKPTLNSFCPTVFSTSVEVFLSFFKGYIRLVGLLHVRGGVSARSFAFCEFPQSSPRPWRCFQLKLGKKMLELVFSTSVEVFPDRGTTLSRPFGLLHVRGGVSYVC